MSFFGLSVLALSLLLGLRRWLWRLRGGWLCFAVRRRLCFLVVAVAVGLFSALRLSVLLLLFSLCPPVLLLYMMARLAGCGGGGPFLSRFVCLVLLVALYKLVVVTTACAVALERALGLL